MTRNLKGSATKQMVIAARALRKEETHAEKILWEVLRNRKLSNRKFRRQHPLDNFNLDFFCVEENLAIEVDGGIHINTDQAERDRWRDEELAQREIRVLRIKKDVFRDIENVKQTIMSYFQKLG